MLNYGCRKFGGDGRKFILGFSSTSFSHSSCRGGGGKRCDYFFLPCFVSSLVYLFFFFSSIIWVGCLNYIILFFFPHLCLGEFETAGPGSWGERGVERERGRWGVEKLKFRLGDESEGFEGF